MIDETLLSDPRFVAWADELLELPKAARNAEVEKIVRLACPSRKRGRPPSDMTREELAKYEQGHAVLGQTAKQGFELLLLIVAAIQQHGPEAWTARFVEKAQNAHTDADLVALMTAPAPGKRLPKPDARRVRNFQNRLSRARRKYRRE